MSLFKAIFGSKTNSTKSYQDFWNWFLENEKSFFNSIKQNKNIEKDVFKKLSRSLNEVKEGYFFLVGMLDENTAELVLTTDGDINNIVFVEELVNAAPKIDSWKFTALKPALDINDVNIKMGGYEFNSSNLSFVSNKHPQHPDEIDITVIHNDFNEENKNAITNGVYIFLDNCLGELEFVTGIDNLKISGKKDVQEELIPIVKLKDYLVWRQKEFIEKYEGTRRNTDNDSYAILEAETGDGRKLIATINTDILKWDSKASHPWIMTVEIKLADKKIRGIPGEELFKLLEEIEENISAELKDFDGYINIGRQTDNVTREIYFACKDFRKPSKILYTLQNKYSHKIDLSYNIYKDKYWQSVDRFNAN